MSAKRRKRSTGFVFITSSEPRLLERFLVEHGRLYWCNPATQESLNGTAFLADPGEIWRRVMHQRKTLCVSVDDEGGIRGYSLQDEPPPKAEAPYSADHALPNGWL